MLKKVWPHNFLLPPPSLQHSLHMGGSYSDFFFSENLLQKSVYYCIRKSEKKGGGEREMWGEDTVHGVYVMLRLFLSRNICGAIPSK